MITTLHYITCLHSVLLHEVFQRLYYIPIVVAAVLFGWRTALATSLLATVMYLPHVVLDWHAWPVVQADQYGEILLFNLVALVTGLLADRVRQERNRARQAAADLRDLVASAVRLARPTVERRGLGIDLRSGEGATPVVAVDAEQFQRALVSLLLSPLAPGRRGRLRVTTFSDSVHAVVHVDIPGVADAARIAAEVFDPTVWERPWAVAGRGAPLGREPGRHGVRRGFLGEPSLRD